MTQPSITGMFATHAFLQNLSERHLMILASAAQPFTAEAGELLAREGDNAKAFYLIQSGHVSVGIHTAERGVVTVQTVGPGETVGWSWLEPPYRWQFDCRAKDKVQGIRFDAVWLRDKCAEDHELGFHLVKRLVVVIASRLAATRRQLLDWYK